MDKRLFVGGLPYSMTDQTLADLFSPHGKVDSATVIMDKFSGRSKGFGFVEMATAEEAQAAIKALDGTEVEGRKIVVNVARPREERPQRDFGGGRPYSGGRDRGDRRDFSRGGGRNRY